MKRQSSIFYKRSFMILAAPSTLFFSLIVYPLRILHYHLVSQSGQFSKADNFLDTALFSYLDARKMNKLFSLKHLVLIRFSLY